MNQRNPSRVAALGIGALLFSALSQLYMAAWFFDDDIGKIELPFALLFVVPTLLMLAPASRLDGAYIDHPVTKTLGVTLWIAVAYMAWHTTLGPWTWISVTEFLGATHRTCVIRANVRLPLHWLNALGPLFLTATLCSVERAQQVRLGVFLVGALPWILARLLYGALLLQMPLT